MSKIAIGETMGDARFFARSGPYCLADIAAAAKGVAGPVAAGRVFTGVSPLQTATSDQVSFLDNRRYAAALDVTQARRRHRPPGHGRPRASIVRADRHRRYL